MVDQDSADPQFNATTARLLRREALRRAAKVLSIVTGPGLENAWRRSRQRLLRKLPMGAGPAECCQVQA